MNKFKKNVLLNFVNLGETTINIDKITLYCLNNYNKLKIVLVDRLINEVVKHNKINIISNLKPFKTIVKLGTGVVNLFIIPAKEYQKSGKLLTGIRKGLNNLHENTINECFNLGYDLTNLADNVVLGFEEAVGPIENGQTELDKGNYIIKEEDGIINVPKYMYNGLNNLKEMIVTIPIKEYNNKGILKAINSLVRNSPNIVIEPIKGITKTIKDTFSTIKKKPNDK